jgi:hypothetical protein
MLRTIQRWSDQLESTLEGCFDHVDWDMFQVACKNNLDAYKDTVTEFIRKCIGDVVPTVTIKTYPNQKLWIDGGIRVKLKARTIAFNHCKATGNMAEYKQCSYSLHKAIKQAKLQYRDKWSRNSTAQTRDVCGRGFRQSRTTKGKLAMSPRPMSCFQTGETHSSHALTITPTYQGLWALLLRGGCE